MNDILNMRQEIKAQSILEYVILVSAVSIAFAGIYLFMNRGVNAKFKILEMQVNELPRQKTTTSIGG